MWDPAAGGEGVGFAASAGLPMLVAGGEGDHGGCMCRRDVATSVCDTADFLALEFFALLSGGDDGDD